MGAATRRMLRPRRLAVGLAVAAVLVVGTPHTAFADVIENSGGANLDTCGAWSNRFECDGGASRGAYAVRDRYRRPGFVEHRGRAAEVWFHPYGEHVVVLDPTTDGWYAWAHVRRYVPSASGATGVHQYRLSSGDTIERNFDWPEDQVVRIRACNGTATDYDAHGCTGWYRGRS